MKLQVEIIDGDKTSMLQMENASHEHELAIINQFFSAVTRRPEEPFPATKETLAAAGVESISEYYEGLSKPSGKLFMDSSSKEVGLKEQSDKKINDAASTSKHIVQSIHNEIEKRRKYDDQVRQRLQQESSSEKGHDSERNRRLPLLGQENRSSFSIADQLETKKNDLAVTKTDIAPIANEPEYWKTGIKVDEDGTQRYKCHYWCECGKQGNHYIEMGSLDTECHECGAAIDVEPATKKTDKDGVPERDTWGNFFIAKYQN